MAEYRQDIPAAQVQQPPPPMQQQAPPPTPLPEQRGELLGNPLTTVALRSAQIFVFWFALAMILGFVYNEVVVSETMRQWTGNPAHVEYESAEEAAIMNTDFDKYRVDNHQIVSFAAAFAGMVLLARFFLEALCFYVGKEMCARVSGQAIYVATEPSAYRQDQQLPCSQYGQDQQPAHEVTRQQMYAPPESLDGGSGGGSNHHDRNGGEHRRHHRQ